MKYLVVAIVLFGFVSCQKDKKEYKEIQDANPTSLQNEIHEGKKLMETHCYLCHSPNAAENEGRIAPPMVAIKARYIDKEGYNKEEFVKSSEKRRNIEKKNKIARITGHILMFFFFLMK